MKNQSAPVSVRLSIEAKQVLAANGFNLTGLGQTGQLRVGSKIEGPVSLIATVQTDSFLELGAFCNISSGTIGNVTIGRYCSFAEGVTIGAHAHPIDWLTTSRTAYYPQVRGWDRLMLGDAAETLSSRKPAFTGSCPHTSIGADVWLGQGVFVKAGVKIGAGAVVGARSVVTRDIPPYAVCVGTPARLLRMRFDEALVERMLRVAWWQYNIYELFDAPLERPDEALDKIEELAFKGEVKPYNPPTLNDLVGSVAAVNSSVAM